MIISKKIKSVLKSDENRKEKITIRLHALNWTMGEVAFFDLALSGIGSLQADWGDGHTASCQSFHAGEPIRIEHDYGSKVKAAEEHLFSSCVTQIAVDPIFD